MADLTPLTPRTLRRCEVTLLAALYWPLAEIDNAVNVAQLESAWNTAARNTKGEDSRGLWQINVRAHPHLLDVNLFDPQVNAYYAYEIWRDAGSWRPWLNAARVLGLRV
jgi:hypothetical protein